MSSPERLIQRADVVKGKITVHKCFVNSYSALGVSVLERSIRVTFPTSEQ